VTTTRPGARDETPASAPSTRGTVAVLAGGVGAARFLTGLVQVTAPDDIVAIVNVADDFELHGLRISPDLDTVTYTLAGAVNPETGWGLAGESWQAMETLRRYGGETWFNLGDRDLGTHLYRTHRLRQGTILSTVTAEIAAGWGVRTRIVPVSNDVVRTQVTVIDPGGSDEGIEVSFQEYFVQRRHAVPVRHIRFEGVEQAQPDAGALDALTAADTIVIAPSNPIVSIGPVLAIPGITETMRARRDRVVAVSPIIAGAALKGPADRLLSELGHDASVVGVARLYREVASTLVIDHADAALAPAVEAEGLRCVVARTIMRDPTSAAALARVVVAVGAAKGHR
jgi:LPPG:FO 2-phospho-L-lactate transferase